MQAQSLTGNPFTSTTSLSLKFNDIGKYSFHFHMLMYCGQIGCENAQDYIEIAFLSSDSRSIKQSKKFYLKDLEQENKWIEKMFEFTVENEKEKVQNVRN